MHAGNHRPGGNQLTVGNCNTTHNTKQQTTTHLVSCAHGNIQHTTNDTHNNQPGDANGSNHAGGDNGADADDDNDGDGGGAHSHGHGIDVVVVALAWAW